jgi:hypothetical protein
VRENSAQAVTDLRVEDTIFRGGFGFINSKQLIAVVTKV